MHVVFLPTSMEEHAKVVDPPNPFLFLRNHFTLSQEKYWFFEAFTKTFPFQDPEIQSSDGEFIDVLFKNGVVLSLTEENHVSISTPSTFQYFPWSKEKGGWENALEFLSTEIKSNQ